MTAHDVAPAAPPAPSVLRQASGAEAAHGDTRATHSLVNFLPRDVKGFDSLAELALDLRWSWNHGADHLWEQLDPELWALTRNPWGATADRVPGADRAIVRRPGISS